MSRIFCIGKNYAAHIQELAHLGHKHDGECVVFMKPGSCVVPPGPLVLPRDRGAIHHEAELVLRVGRAGQNIAAEHATDHIDAIGLGLDLTLRDLQTKLKNAGKPWELAKAFDHAAPLSELRAVNADDDFGNMTYTCHVNGELRQQADTANMLFTVPRMIAILSATWALQPGDLVFTGTPEGVGPIEPGDTVELNGLGLKAGWDCR